MMRFKYILLSFWHTFEVLFASFLAIVGTFIGWLFIFENKKWVTEFIAQIFFFVILPLVFMGTFFLVSRWSARRLAKNGYSNVRKIIALISGIFIFIIMCLITNFFFYMIGSVRENPALFDYLDFGIPVGIIFALPLYFLTQKYTHAEANK